MAQEALGLHVEGMLEDGDAIPPPSTLETIMQARENRNAVAVLIDLPGKHRPPIRINVTLPEDLVAAIDRVAKNRSRFLAEAAWEKIRETS